MRSTIIAVLLLIMCGCGMATQEGQVYGRYELVSGQITIKLDVRPDHTYTEVVRFGGGQDERRDGKWRWDSLCVDFDAFTVPKKVLADNFSDPKDETESEQHSKRATESSKDLSSWCLSAERVFGKTRLVVDPDRDIMFKMVDTR